MSSALPSVHLEALGESCFTQTPDGGPSTSHQAPAAAANANGAAEATLDSVLPAKDGSRVLNLKNMFDGIYLGDAPSGAGSPTAAPPPLKLPGRDSASTGASVKLPPRPPSTPGSDRLLSGGKRVSAEKALQRATLSDNSLSKSSSFHADRNSGGGTTPGTPGGSGISLTARNLVLKEKMEKKEKEKSQTKKHAMASRPESIAIAGMDEEELEALAGVLLMQGDPVILLAC